jgi:hypothetical protein
MKPTKPIKKNCNQVRKPTSPSYSKDCDYETYLPALAHKGNTVRFGASCDIAERLTTMQTHRQQRRQNRQRKSEKIDAIAK